MKPDRSNPFVLRVVIAVQLAALLLLTGVCLGHKGRLRTAERRVETLSRLNAEYRGRLTEFDLGGDARRREVEALLRERMQDRRYMADLEGRVRVYEMSYPDHAPQPAPVSMPAEGGR